MSQTPALESTADTSKALIAADHITPDFINAIEVPPPAMQSAEMVAKGTFKRYLGILATLKEAYGERPIDCATTAGDKDARAIRLKFVTLRNRADDTRKEHNRVFIAQQKANNDEFKMLEDTVLPIEKRYDDAIKAAEQAREERKRQEEEAARQKAEAITRSIQAIDAMADDLVAKTAAELDVLRQEVTLIDLSEEELGARFSEAVTVKDRTIARIEAAHAAAVTNEANAREAREARERFAAERAEMERKQQEERARFEAERQEAEKRRQEEEAARAERERVENERRAKEDAARSKLMALHSVLGRFVMAGSSAIDEEIARVQGLMAADFDPFGAEAAQAQADTLAGLQSLRTAAVERERTAAQAKAAAERAQAIELRISNIAGMPGRLRASGASLGEIRGSFNALAEMSITEADFGDRTAEASIAVEKAGAEVEALLAEAQAAEEEAARIQRERKEQQDREEAERQRRAAEEAFRTEFERRLTSNARAMFDALEDVRADAAFTQLAKPLQQRIDAITSAIAITTKA